MTSRASWTAAFAAVLLIMLAVVTPAAAQCITMAPGAGNSLTTSPWLTPEGTPCNIVAVGTECTANCKTGFTSVPAPKITCNADGTWSAVIGSPGACSPVCTNPPAVVAGITWGTAANTYCANSIAGQTNCLGTCDIGTGNPTAKCSIIRDATTGASVWTYAGGCVGAGGCPTGPPVTPTSAQPITGCLAGNNGAVCPFTCNTNYVADTPAGVIATCTDGAWVNSGVCVKACTTAPPALANGAWANCADSPAGFVCTGTCNGGFTGSPTITCAASGRWINKIGACAPTGGCPDVPPLVTNAAAPSPKCAGMIVGGACSYDCSVGAAPAVTFGPSAGFGHHVKRFCNNGGIWSEPSAQCIQVCRILALDGVTPLVPTLLFGDWDNDCTYTPVGGKCIGVCMQGRFGAPYTVCSSAGFGVVEGGCFESPVCAGVPAVAEGVVNGGWPAGCANTPAGGACDIQCNTGYTGTAAVACVANPSNVGTGADWATTFTGTMCAKASVPLRHRLV